MGEDVVRLSYMSPNDVIGDEWVLVKLDDIVFFSDRYDELRDENERLLDRVADLNMHAHRWMECHDKLAAGEPYDLPAVVDLPNVIAENERLQGALGFYAARDNHLSSWCLNGARWLEPVVKQDGGEIARTALATAKGIP